MNVLIVTSPAYEDFVYSAVEELDFRNGLVFAIKDIHDYEKFVTKFSYDIGISFMWTHKISKRELNRAKWFNFHPAPLPEYKGRNVVYHAIMNGEREFGASLHYMDENFDTGEIIDVLYFPIEESDTAEDVHDKAIEHSQKLFERYFLAIAMGVPLKSYPNVGGNYYRKENIPSFIEVDECFKKQVRAITYGVFTPKVNIGGVTYKIVRDE